MSGTRKTHAGKKEKAAVKSARSSTRASMRGSRPAKAAAALQDAADAAAMRDAKRALRSEVALHVAAIRPFARERAAERAAQRALRSPVFAAVLSRAATMRPGGGHAASRPTVLVYRALTDELDTDALVRLLAARGVRIAYPSVPADAAPRLDLLAIDAADPLDSRLWTVDRYGIRAPLVEAREVQRIAAREVDAVVVPGRAFDARGRRIGRGKGFYDRLLPRLRPDARAASLGYAFACQLLDEVPIEPHDARVAWVATDRALVRAGGRAPMRMPSSLAAEAEDEVTGADGK